MPFNFYTHHRHSIRLPGYDYSQAGVYFVTMVTQERACLFVEVVDGEMRLNATGKNVGWEWQRLCQRFPHIHLGSFIVMPNHVHAILITNPTTNIGAATVRATTVGATQAGLSGNLAAEGEKSNVNSSGNDGSPRFADVQSMTRCARGHSVDGVSDGLDRATRSVQMGIRGVDVPVQDEAINDLGGSPLRGDGFPRSADGCSADGGGLDGRDGATRNGQTDVMGGDAAVPDEAMVEMGGSPLRGEPMLDGQDGGPHGPSRGSVGALIGQWKSRVTKRLWKMPELKGIPIWQRNYYEHIILNAAEHERIEAYIADNPANWHTDDENPGKIT